MRTKRAVSNFITGIILQIITLLVGLFSTPLLLSWLGDDRYGAFRAASDWVGYLALLELGIGGSVRALLAKAVGSGDRQQIRLTLAVGIRAYLQIMAGMGLVGVGLGLFITQLVPVPETLTGELQKGYWLGFLGILLLPLAPFNFLVDASQRSYFANVFLTFQSLLITGMTLLLAKVGFGIPGQYLAVLLGNIAFQFLMCWDGLRSYPDVFAAVFEGKSHEKIKKQLRQLNLPTLALNLSGKLSLFTDNIIISYSINPAAVVPFFVTQRLAGLAQSQIQSIGNATWAALTELYAKGERDKFNARLIELTRLVAVMGLAFMLAIVVYNPYFINLWVGIDRFSGNGVSILAACNGFLLGLFTLWNWCFGGTGNVAKLVKPAMISTTINLFVSLLSTRLFGVIGPLLGTFVAFITIQIWWLPLLLRQVFGTSLKQLFLAVAKPLALGCPYGIVMWLITKSHTPWGWFGLAAEMVITALMYLILAWLFVFNKDERSQWISRFHIV